jgi:ParB family chromosome partitioning protein|nr:ParB/RepB/Spo0J family partition protein [Ruminococcus bromii]
MERKPTLTTIAIEKLHPHPDNPRKVLGDIDELADSIKANGILQNLTVVPMNDDWTEFTVIIGHRRLAAAKQAGLTELPCAVVEMTEKEQLSTMLTENMQRSDLTVYEEAKGCQLLLDLGDTVAEVAEKTGFSESKIRRRVKLCELDEEAFKESQIRQPTLADYDRLNQIKDIDVRNKLLKSIGTNNFDNLLYSAVQKQQDDEERTWLEEICLDNGMTKCESRNDIPENCEYVGTVGTAQLLKESFDDDRKRYFFFTTYGIYVAIYIQKTKEQIENADAENKNRNAKRQKFDELEAQAKEINQRCKALREGFMLKGNFNDDAKKQELINYILYSMSECREYDDRSFYSLSGLKHENYECINLDDCIKDTGKMLMAAAYAFFEDLYNTKYINVTYDEGIQRNISPELNRFYNLLVKLGYVMSDEEIQLRDGTHPIFTTGETN